ncbi:pyruvate carboxylase [Halotalea alkalilenta]|nr:pyruvate carboxylase [Halotalea alkalilenta]
MMFKKILVANRGEIAVRAFRAAVELGARTVAVFAHEDRHSEHCLKADEAYPIGEQGHPVRAYLSIDEIIRVAKMSGADAVYPGYGFLSENAGLARACRDAGIVFIGPPAEVLEVAGDKVRALAKAREQGIPVLASSAPSSDLDALLEAAGPMTYPLFVKAVAGGGGRGMRRVAEQGELQGALEAAMREAEGAFGDPTVFIEQAVQRPRHVEVQILGDSQGGVIHLFERDCSVQRRHQKVVEIAPAPNLDPTVREALHRDAVSFARALGYRNAGTVEFLLETAGPNAGQHVFIEMNPRIQVEHTVTEEITDVDLVQAQIRIACGESLAELGLSQEALRVNGAALQCRITTEDPANGFRPDTGMITAYRAAGGAGVRLDGGTAYAGAEVSPHFDSMLVKLTCRGRDFPLAVARARRALAEFRIRGVSSNIAFLQGVLDEEAFLKGDLSTAFIEERPRLLQALPSQDRGTKLLSWLAEVTVNRPFGPPPGGVEPASKLPPLPEAEPSPGSRQRLLAVGAEAFARELRQSPRVWITDTTFRDAHQSLLATRVRSYDLLAVAPYVARLTPELLSVECWGGATYDVALRFLGEDPWERLARLRQALPNVALQMLLRGRNTVGYTPYPTAVSDAFIEAAAAQGVDIFRIFDSLNDVEQMRPAIEAVRRTHAVAEVALCYTGDLSDPAETLYTLDYYLGLAERIVAAGAHILAIKDMAGLLRPQAARILVEALRSRFELPIHLHTHDTAGGQLATLMAAVEAGADAVDAACAAMSGTTSQPSLASLVAAYAHTPRDTGLSLAAVNSLEPYWEAVRKLYLPFEAGLPAPTGRVYHHEIPGGQLSNLRQQAVALGLGDRFEAIEEMYARADRLLGRLVKVTPSSKVVGDLALQLVAVGADIEQFAADPQRFDIPDSVIGFLAGDLGTPPGGWPEPFRSRALAGRSRKPAIAELDDESRAALALPGPARRQLLNRLLFAAPAKAFEQVRARYGDLSVLSSADYFYGLSPGEEHAVMLEEGVRLLVAIRAIGASDERGMRQVMCSLNGQLRPLSVRDHSVTAEQHETEKADPTEPGQVAVPYAGVVTVTARAGEPIEAGAPLATLEAMKMEATITAPIAGALDRVIPSGPRAMEAGDLIAVIRP